METLVQKPFTTSISSNATNNLPMKICYDQLSDNISLQNTEFLLVLTVFKRCGNQGILKFRDTPAEPHADKDGLRKSLIKYNDINQVISYKLRVRGLMYWPEAFGLGPIHLIEARIWASARSGQSDYPRTLQNSIICMFNILYERVDDGLVLVCWCIN